MKSSPCPEHIMKLSLITLSVVVWTLLTTAWLCYSELFG